MVENDEANVIEMAALLSRALQMFVIMWTRKGVDGKM